MVVRDILIHAVREVCIEQVDSMWSDGFGIGKELMRRKLEFGIRNSRCGSSSITELQLGARPGRLL